MITLESQTKSLTCGKVKIKFVQLLPTGRLYYEYERKIFFSDSKYLFVSERNDEKSLFVHAFISQVSTKAQPRYCFSLILFLRAANYFHFSSLQVIAGFLV